MTDQPPLDPCLDFATLQPTATPCGGTYKNSPGDFVVEELPLYEPSGEGDHLFLTVRKENVAHGDLVAAVASAVGVDRSQVRHAGMKDRLGVTTQSLSIKTDKTAAPAEIADGAVVGSAIVEKIGAGESAEDVLTFVKSLADGCHRAQG